MQGLRNHAERNKMKVARLSNMYLGQNGGQLCLRAPRWGVWLLGISVDKYIHYDHWQQNFARSLKNTETRDSKELNGASLIDQWSLINNHVKRWRRRFIDWSMINNHVSLMIDQQSCFIDQWSKIMFHWSMIKNHVSLFNDQQSCEKVKTTLRLLITDQQSFLIDQWPRIMWKGEDDQRSCHQQLHPWRENKFTHGLYASLYNVSLADMSGNSSNEWVLSQSNTIFIVIITKMTLTWLDVWQAHLQHWPALLLSASPPRSTCPLQSSRPPLGVVVPWTLSPIGCLWRIERAELDQDLTCCSMMHLDGCHEARNGVSQRPV